MTRTARLVALGGLLFAILGWFEAAKLDSWGWDGPGPGLLPQVLSVLFGIVALAVLAWPGDPTVEPEGGEAPWRNRTFLAYGIAMLGVAITLPYLGFILPMVVGTVVMLRFGERTSWFQAVLYGVLLTAGITLIFGTALGVPFPSGVAERVLYSFGLLRGA
ncbi:tripartite tricarboxylate transporter TctB family protein [Roseococcus sp. YIM B11640]|uniref:tripartite tricarboxylate transporter TctB family protein n=1 Tax=Roseococcus sp. YIM B11640 TaxID=3133973 RepID=UPI003C7CB289